MNSTNNALALLGSNPIAELPQNGIQTFEGGTFITFVHPNAPTFRDIITVLPKAVEGDRVLMGYGEKPVDVNDASFLFTPLYFQHFSVIDEQNGVVRANFSREAVARDRSYKEHIEAIVIVITDDFITPAKITLRGGRAQAGREIYKTIEGKAHTLDYMPDDWAMTNVPEATKYARYVWQMDNEKQMPKSAAEPGKKQFPFWVTSERFTSMDEETFTRVQEAMNSAEFSADVSKCRDALQARYAFVKSKVM